MAYQ